MECPNCGHPLVDYRVDRQSPSDREIVLCWAICSSCRHVVLRDWYWADVGSLRDLAARAHR